MQLIELKSGDRARIIDIHGRDGLNQHLALRGVQIGRIVTMVSCTFGPVVLQSGGGEVVLGRRMASQIVVERLYDTEIIDPDEIWRDRGCHRTPWFPSRFKLPWHQKRKAPEDDHQATDQGAGGCPCRRGRGRHGP
ncbi:ferrous iron transport protein A [Methanofollis aquaemaris]|uniref:Ferrous iron transport protein A n=1 Tax=Methanofollis aquaemaris TaxID=126734 RepID=A0A8A3S3F1_9EURY|nr:ferrous iron transport protein A [Methanofollis aquaemaris]